MVPKQSLAAAVGKNCERLRNQMGITQDELARHARDLGLRWKASSVGDFEAGRSAPKFATVVTVAVALQLALEDVIRRGGDTAELPAGVSLADLAVSDGWVMLNETFKVPGTFMRDACRGQVATFAGSPFGETMKVQGVVIDAVADILRRAGLTEQRQAKRLGIEPPLLAALSLKLWQGTFTEERDRRAGPDANNQRRGQVTRAMQAELDELLPRFTQRGGELAKLAAAEVWANGDDQ